MLSIINESIVTGQVPDDFKQAIIKPLLKKTNLESCVLGVQVEWYDSMKREEKKMESEWAV